MRSLLFFSRLSGYKMRSLLFFSRLSGVQNEISSVLFQAFRVQNEISSVLFQAFRAQDERYTGDLPRISATMKTAQSTVTTRSWLRAAVSRPGPGV